MGETLPTPTALTLINPPLSRHGIPKEKGVNTQILRYIGKSMYHTHTFKGFKRYIVFRIRCFFHPKDVQELLEFFNGNELRRQILERNPSVVEQATRAFFYLKSTWNERTEIVKNHFLILEKLFKPEFLEILYVKEQDIVLWEEEWQGKPLSLVLHFEGGQRKEGCLSLLLLYDGELLYQIIFWLAYAKDGVTPVIYVGALQGMKNGSQLIKELTKAFFGYRTKNLIFYGLRCFAKDIGAKVIYGVTNEGYYAMNHIRLDRKLKTSFNDFWKECEGIQFDDVRFFEIPVEETRKSIEEVKSSKRAQYRRRFEKLDQIQTSIDQALVPFKNPTENA
ncbi:MAG: VirK/YbjX family protein [Burkholderiales bacterium]|nr:VirK/YbjX family protein [Burkholderiales bacterium]